MLGFFSSLKHQPHLKINENNVQFKNDYLNHRRVIYPPTYLMPKIYRANNTIEDIHPENGVDFTLKEVQTLVGGYIERIQNSNSPLIVLANEEARLQGLPFNNQISIKLGIELYGDILIIEHEYFR